MADQMTNKKQAARREFVKKTAYVAPLILTLKATPAFAKKGSEKPDKPGKGKGR